MILGGRWVYKKVKQKRELKRMETASREGAQDVQKAPTDDHTPTDGRTEAIELPGSFPEPQSTQTTPTSNSFANYSQPQQHPTINRPNEYAPPQYAMSSDAQTKSPVEDPLSAYPAPLFSPVQHEIVVKGKWIWIPEQVQADVAPASQFEKEIGPTLDEGVPLCELPHENSIHELMSYKESEDMTRQMSVSSSVYSQPLNQA
jgi:hypothetical protein